MTIAPNRRMPERGWTKTPTGMRIHARMICQRKADGVSVRPRLCCAIILFAPLLIYRSLRSGKYRSGWSEKLLGRSPRRIGGNPCVWFHAVSVGEVLLLKPIIAELERKRPDWDLVISTTTQTGLAVARQTYPDLVTFYAPLDLSWSTRNAVSRIRPTVLALVELELWPNLIRSAKAFGSAVLIVNGRLSHRSHSGYRALRGPLGPTFQRLDLIAAQTQEYAARFADLGVPQERVKVTGSVKFDNLSVDRENPKTMAIREELEIPDESVVFVAGSTMEGEESAALSAYNQARREFPNLRLILVPRHAERFSRVAQKLLEAGETVVRRTSHEAGPHTNLRPPIYLIDTLGELGAVWGLADIAFVGGSLFPGRGGQNMLEPASYGASVLFGPYVSNFRQAVEMLLEKKAARQVNDAEALAKAVLDDLRDPDSAYERGRAAQAFLSAQNGASGRTIAEIDSLVEKILASRSA